MLRVAEHFQRTDTGRQRRANEDSHFAQSPLFVVADGMGGAQAGEVASQLAVEMFAAGLPDGSETIEARLAERVLAANRAIHEQSAADPTRTGMGTTCTAIYVSDDGIAIAHVGDSRAYRLRDGVLERLTRDHSLVGELVEKGKLTPEEAEEHPQRSIITRALGPEPTVAVDTSTAPGRDGDVVLVCSDGLTSMIGEELIARLLVDSASLAVAGRALIDAANEAGGRDNITVILLRLENVDSAAGPQRDEQLTTAAHASPSHDQVRAAVADAEMASAARPSALRAARREPRTPAAPPNRVRRRGLSRSVKVLVLLGALATPVIIAAVVALQSVYFIGTDPKGHVSVFRGLPYELPAGINLYSTTFVSGVPASAVPDDRRERLLDHKLRSHGDATDLVLQLEQGTLTG